MAEYGVHPYYVVIDPVTGTCHSVLFFNSNTQGERRIYINDGRKIAVTVIMSRRLEGEKA